MYDVRNNNKVTIAVMLKHGPVARSSDYSAFIFLIIH